MKNCLYLLAILFGAFLSTAEAEHGSDFRSFLVGGVAPARYVAQVAAFGNPLDGKDGNDATRTYNLMRAPDPWLCELPDQYYSLIGNETLLDNPEDVSSRPVALFVSINRCSAEQKARVAAQIQKTITSRIELLVVFSPDPRDLNLLELQPDNPDAPPDPDLSKIGLVHVSYRYAVGINDRLLIAQNGFDPRFLLNNNNLWDFPIQLSNYSGFYNYDGLSDSSDDYRGSTYDEREEDGQNIAWFRVILFAVLILSPCCRAAYLWYSSGGRFYFRRNEQGRIIGLQYVSPSPTWLSYGRFASASGGPPPNQSTDVLTEEQFNSLPEIEYKALPSHYDEDHEDTEGGTTEPTAAGDKQSSSHEFASAAGSMRDLDDCEKVDSDAESQKSYEEIASSVHDATECSLNEHHESNQEQDCSKNGESIQTVNSNVEDSTAVNLKADKEEKLSCPKISTETPSDEGTADLKIEDSAISKIASTAADIDEMERGTAGDSSEEELTCKSTMCSICIDDFEEGEKLVLLPRCNHGFHRECIRPWLTERQGCCPFCKTPVFEIPESEQAEASTAEDDAKAAPPVAEMPETTGISQERERPQFDGPNDV